MTFFGTVDVEFLDDGRLVRVNKHFMYCDSKYLYWHVAKGLVVDGASIPHALWSLIGGPFEGRYRRAAILHDAAYQSQARTRAQCDRMFYEAMREDGVSYIKAQTLWLAVRAGGFLAWREKGDSGKRA